MDLLATGFAWLEKKRHETMSHAVSYQRGTNFVLLNASNGRSEFEIMDDNGLAIQLESRDFLVRSADLMIGGNVITPEPGDTITENGRIYEVNRFAGAPQYRIIDPAGSTLRIHTKLA